MLFLFQDPPRHEVAAAVEDCREAGIRVMVITGDYKNTAEAICQEIGVLKPEDDLALCSFTTRDFMELRHSKRAEILRVSASSCANCIQCAFNVIFQAPEILNNKRLHGAPSHMDRLRRLRPCQEACVLSSASQR